MAPRRDILAACVIAAVVLVGLAQAQPPPQRTYLPVIARADPVELVFNEPAGGPTIRNARSFAFEGRRYVVGEVVNTTGAPIYAALVRARFFNAAGQFLATDDTLAFLTMTAPGQRNPFEVVVSNAPAGIVRAEIDLSWRTTSPLEHFAVAVVSRELRAGQGLEVSGMVRNDQAEPLSNVEVAVTYYDAAGQVLVSDFSLAAAGPLLPGATAPYSVQTDELVPYASYTVQAQGETPP